LQVATQINRSFYRYNLLDVHYFTDPDGGYIAIGLLEDIYLLTRLHNSRYYPDHNYRRCADTGAQDTQDAN